MKDRLVVVAIGSFSQDEGESQAITRLLSPAGQLESMKGIQTP
jgi:hypothetical protein